MTPLDSGLADRCRYCGKWPMIERWYGGGAHARTIFCTNPFCVVRPMVKGTTGGKALVEWNRENERE